MIRKPICHIILVSFLVVYTSGNPVDNSSSKDKSANDETQQVAIMQSQTRKNARETLTNYIVDIKLRHNISFAALAQGTNLSVVYVTAALLGQHALSQNIANLVGGRLGLKPDQIALLQTVPVRGSSSRSGSDGGPPSDPTLYRFYEMIQIYAPTLRALVHEQFGDGIISAVNFKLDMKKVADPEGGYRAVITLDGKFLPFKPF